MRTPHLALLPLALVAAFASAQTAPASAFVVPGSIQPATHFDPEHPCALPTICDTFGSFLQPQAVAQLGVRHRTRHTDWQPRIDGHSANLL
jgi:hypothetical protein